MTNDVNILEAKHLTKKFGGVTAVHACSFLLKQNSITALIGPNGAGKTTVFDLITGLTALDSGTIIFNGGEITNQATYRRARRGIARTFQAVRIFPELTAMDNVLLALQGHPERITDIFFSLRKKRAALRSRAHALLESVGLGDKANHKAGRLSYGQQKLLEIARTVATDAELILLDEPAAGVNRTLLHTIIELIKKLKKAGKTIFIIEHDMGFVMNLAEEVIVMDYGKEIDVGSPAEVQKNPRVLEAYLGVKG